MDSFFDEKQITWKLFLLMLPKDIYKLDLLAKSVYVSRSRGKREESREGETKRENREQSLTYLFYKYLLRSPDMPNFTRCSGFRDEYETVPASREATRMGTIWRWRSLAVLFTEALLVITTVPGME